jgi:hypothetical protein
MGSLLRFSFAAIVKTITEMLHFALYIYYSLSIRNVQCRNSDSWFQTIRIRWSEESAKSNCSLCTTESLVRVFCRWIARANSPRLYRKLNFRKASMWSNQSIQIYQLLRAEFDPHYVEGHGEITECRDIRAPCNQVDGHASKMP